MRIPDCIKEPEGKLGYVQHHLAKVRAEILLLQSREVELQAQVRIIQAEIKRKKDQVKGQGYL